MKDSPRKRVLRVRCAKCGLLRIVSGKMTRKEVEEINKSYVCTDCT